MRQMTTSAASAAANTVPFCRAMAMLLPARPETLTSMGATMRPIQSVHHSATGACLTVRDACVVNTAAASRYSAFFSTRWAGASGTSSGSSASSSVLTTW